MRSKKSPEASRSSFKILMEIDFFRDFRLRKIALNVPSPDQVSLSQKASDSALTSLSVQAGGSLAAVGDADGARS